jgi:flagellar hook assembly protein FlgD
MTLLRAALAALAALAFVLAVPVTAGAADRMFARDEPVGALRPGDASAPHRTARPFDLVGLHWQGTGTVRFRTLSVRGTWSVWRAALTEAEDAPDRDSAEAAGRQAWKLGSPYWTGSASAIQYRLAGDVSRLRAYFVWSDPLTAQSGPRPLDARTEQPTVIRRAQWGADESIVRAPPYYASALHFAVVHHTAGTNSYSASQSAAIVRGIERYHVLANGWNDIGYNFLVDKYGQVFEGRGGGIAKNVVGAHAEGFNTGSTGVALLGTYESTKISAAARAALVRLLAWRLDVAHVDPLSRLMWASGGNPKYPAGTNVSLRAISGHRDTGPTSCPGSSLYAQLPGIARGVAATGLPKLYAPVVSGSLGGPVRFTATLTAALPWTVTIADAAGNTVATGSGTGKLVDWTWDASALPSGDLTYTIAAGPDLLPASGRVPGPPPLALVSFRAKPRVVTPNGDGSREQARISYALSARATVKIEVLDSAAAVVRSLASGQVYVSGRPSLVWDGRSSSGNLVRDGEYRVRLTATSAGQEVVANRRMVVDRTLGRLSFAPTPFSPNGDGRLDSASVGFRLSRQADTRVRVMDGDETLQMLHSIGLLPSGAAAFVWDGSMRAGGTAPDGVYRVLVEATTTLGTRSLSRPITLDTRAPVVRVVSARRRDGRTHLRLWLSEGATLDVRYLPLGGGAAAETEAARPPGYSRLTLPRASRVRLQGEDAAANVGSRVVARLPR